MDNATQDKLEAAAWRSLIKHLQHRKDVQNIDLMNLAGFCRNCLYKWLLEAAETQSVELTKDDAIQSVYGMTIDEWKKNHQAKPAKNNCVCSKKPSRYILPSAGINKIISFPEKKFLTFPRMRSR